jgi:hypothetical protein
MAPKIKGKISKTNSNQQTKKTAADHKRRSTQVVFLAISVIIILAMVLSMIRF